MKQGDIVLIKDTHHYGPGRGLIGIITADLTKHPLTSVPIWIRDSKGDYGWYADVDDMELIGHEVEHGSR